MNFEEIPRVYLTLRCNYNCTFCPLEKKRRDTIPGKEWVKILNGWPGDSVILAGGEPTLHPDFLEIVNSLEKREIRIYSNMSFQPSLFRKLNKKLSWYVSFHPGHGDDAQSVIEKARIIIERSDALLSIHINKANPDCGRHVKEFKDQGLELLVEGNLFECEQWASHTAEPLVKCTYPRVYFGPDGKRYSCVAKMEAGDPTGIISDTRFPAVTECADYGRCNVCDVVCHSIESLEPIGPKARHAEPEPVPEPVPGPATDDLSGIQDAVDDYGENHWLKHKMWESIYQPSKPWHLKRLQAILDSAKGSEFLDVACATGEITEEVRKKISPRRCVGYEGSGAVIEKGRSLHPDIDFIPGLVEKMPFKPGEFDSIHAGEIIEHVTDPGAFIDDLAAITRNQLIITTPTTWVRDPGHIAIFTEAGFKEALSARFESVEIIDADRTFVAVCEKQKRQPPKAVKKKARPSLLYLAMVRFDVPSGYVTQVQYQLRAMATAYDVTYAVPRHQDAAKLWRPIKNVNFVQIDLPPGEYWDNEGRAWLDGFDLIVYRNPRFWEAFERMVSPDKALFYVTGSNIGDLIRGQVDQSRGVVNQGSVINSDYINRGLPEKKAIAIPCTIPCGQFALNGKPIFMVISSITQDKGIEDIIDALRPLKDKIRLVIVGGTLPNHVILEPKYYKWLTNKLDSDWGEWIGEVNQSAIPFLLSASTAMIHYNRMKGLYDETLQSTKILEAMAAGKPVIAYASKGTLSLVGDNYPYAVTTGKELLSAAKHIIANPYVAERQGLKLQSRAKKYFNTDVVGRRWRELLENPKRLIWLTSCQFNFKKGDSSQTMYLVESLAKNGIKVDVVFAPDEERKPTETKDMHNVEYHIVDNPQETAICLWAKHRESVVLARGINLTTDLIGSIPKENLCSYLYGNHWKSPDEVIQKIKANCKAVFTQGKEIESLFR